MLFPYTSAVIRLLVIGWFETLVETAQFFPYASRRQQERARAVIDIALEHVHGRGWIIASAVAQARSVSPDDVAGLLQCPIQQDEAAANCADIRRTTDRVQCRLQCSRKKLGVIVQEKQIFTPCFLRALIYSQKEIPIFCISDSTNAAQALQQARCLVLRIVIDDDDFHPLRVVLGERTQAGEGQFRTVEQND